MKEKELRLALVVYGGVSLAVYMHGVTKEILKLARASRDRHALADGGPSPDRSDVRDTENIYLDLLDALEPELDLRVIVDIVAGASAGGINGIILSRALAHDLEIDPVREFWLTQMDVTELMNERVQAGPWNKIAFRPVVWILMWWFRKQLGGDRELKRKLSTFLRSRWLKPPFDGARLTRVLFEGMSAMGDPSSRGRSLLPAGLALDLFVTVTDFFGFKKETPIHDPPTVIEREHRQVIQLKYRQWPAGTEISDFDRDNIPALAFSSRATSSFPGAFPPAQLGECDQLIQEKGIVWKNRVDFLYDNFRPYLSASLNPAEAAFVDGSVLVNKPFAQAIRAIGGRPAFRQVDRRLLYIDPHPRGPRNEEWGQTPGFFRTLKGALSDIPRNEPIHEDLAWVNAYNAEVQRLQTVIDASRSHIQAIVESVSGEVLNGPIDGNTLGRLRRAANAKARSETGFAYDGYLRLKLTSVVKDVAAFLVSLSGYGQNSTDQRKVCSAIDKWADSLAITPSDNSVLDSTDTDASDPPWVRFLLAFDARFRQRRLRFAIRTINDLYARIGEENVTSLTTTDLDRVKAGLYEALDMMASLSEAGRRLSVPASDHLKSLVRQVAEVVTETDGDSDGEIVPLVQPIMDKLGEALEFERHAGRAEDILANLTNDLPDTVRREILDTYIGFAAWDVLTFSITNWRDLDEFNEIRVDRVSPDDAQALRPGGAETCLKGIQFNHFGAFFSRAYRENDYLWGRLHAAERLIDITIDAARVEGSAADIDVNAFKRRAFLAILETEKDNLPSCKMLIAELRGAASVLSGT